MNNIENLSLKERKQRRTNMSEEELNSLKPMVDETGFPHYNEYGIMIMEDGMPWIEPTEEHLKKTLTFKNAPDKFKDTIQDKTITKEQARQLALKYKESIKKELE